MFRMTARATARRLPPPTNLSRLAIVRHTFDLIHADPFRRRCEPEVVESVVHWERDRELRPVRLLIVGGHAEVDVFPCLHRLHVWRRLSVSEGPRDPRRWVVACVTAIGVGA